MLKPFSGRIRMRGDRQVSTFAGLFAGGRSIGAGGWERAFSVTMAFMLSRAQPDGIISHMAATQCQWSDKEPLC